MVKLGLICETALMGKISYVNCHSVPLLVQVNLFVKFCPDSLLVLIYGTRVERVSK